MPPRKTHRDPIEPRPRGRFAPLAVLVAFVLSLALLVPLACGGDRPDEAGPPDDAQQAAAGAAVESPVAGSQPGTQAGATPETAAPEEPESAGKADASAPTTGEAAARPAEETERTGTTEPSEATEKEREALARKQQELDAREAWLARREAALRQTAAPSETAPAATPPSPEPPAARPAGDETASAPSSDVDPAATETDADDWRRSTHRSDRAAREGYEPAPPADSDAEGGMEPGEETWPDRAEPEPEVAPTSRWTSELLPSGTRFTIELLETLSSDRNRAGDTFRARVVDDVTRGGEVVIPAGSTVRGRVTEAVPLDRKIGGRARLGLEFFEIEPPGGEPAPIDADFAAKGKSETAKDAATIGGAAAAGAILGRVLNRGDKGKGSVIGAIVGAAAGTAVASHTEGQEVELPEGAQVELVLTQPAEVPVRMPSR